MKIFRSPCCIQIPSRPVRCARGWVQLIAEKEILIIVASLVHSCAVEKNVIVASQSCCCDRKSRAAYAQSLAPWQQATIQIMSRNLSLRTLVVTFIHSHVNISKATTSHALKLLLVRATYIMVLFFTHIPFMVNHTTNAAPPERLQQHPLLFATNPTDRTFFAWRLNSARPPHPGHSTILLQSEIPSGICAKPRTVAASNNRDHALQSLFAYACRYVQSFTR